MVAFSIYAKVKGHTMNRDEEILKVLEGRVLSSIEFVSSYLQLRFDGYLLNVINYPKLKVDGVSWINYDDKEFCFFLLMCIGLNIDQVRFENNNYLEIYFQNRYIFHVSMEPNNYQLGSAEALLLWDDNGHLMGVW